MTKTMLNLLIGELIIKSHTKLDNLVYFSFLKVKTHQIDKFLNDKTVTGFQNFRVGRKLPNEVRDKQIRYLNLVLIIFWTHLYDAPENPFVKLLPNQAKEIEDALIFLTIWFSSSQYEIVQCRLGRTPEALENIFDFKNAFGLGPTHITREILTRFSLLSKPRRF